MFVSNEGVYGQTRAAGFYFIRQWKRQFFAQIFFNEIPYPTPWNWILLNVLVVTQLSEIFLLLRDSKIRYRVHMSPLLNPVEG